MDYLSFEPPSSGCSSEAEQLLDDLDRILPFDLAEYDHEDTRDAARTSTSSAQERRRKHREGMARLRNERRTNIKRLETQARALHKRLRKALTWIDRHRADHQAHECRCLAYTELVAAAEALIQERYTLEDELYFRERYARLVRNDSARVEEETKAYEAVISTIEESAGYWVQFTDRDPPLFYDYEPVESCSAAIQGGLGVIASVRETLSKTNTNVQSAHCLSWQVEHALTSLDGLEKPQLRYRFSRRVSRLRTTLQELEERTWTMLRTPQLLARMYGSTVIAKVVQDVSNDAFILLRNSPERTNHKRFRFFSLATRLRSADNNSVAVVKTMLPKQPRQLALEQRHGLISADEDDGVVWMRSGSSCFQFTETEDDTIHVEYTGFIECVDRGHALHLVTETCLSLLRWEQFVVPPRTLAQ